MSSDETGETPTSGPGRSPREDAARGRREAVREKAQQVKARQTRNRVLRSSAVVFVVLAALGAAAYGVTSVVVPAMTKPVMNPEGLAADGVVVDDDMTGDAVAEEEPAPDETARAEPIQIHVYVDYLSEAAGQFQRVNAEQLTDWVDQGAVELVYHPVALLTSKSNGTKYSQRAAGAAMCVWEYAPEAFRAYNHELLTNQPQPDGDGYTDAELADRAIATGAEDTKAVRSCIEDEDFFAWAREATERALNEPLPGTDDVTLTGAPMILVNGQPYVGSLDKPEEFAAFLLTVDSEAYLKTAEPEGE
ncbi:DsbA family protein [Microbacterium marinilacus]|uniref:Thioredoxin-like fold domain-containing protein n=1 Tax=Microbacterium marinilacus TaxID=415209 RepID=A0ABP7BGR5_9MICO|nr:thioredoxin domain-containing protein [Microbacterium marinilacus]MBY0688966.1 DsbA family protein [Microbacterium marinilacus]